MFFVRIKTVFLILFPTAEAWLRECYAGQCMSECLLAGGQFLRCRGGRRGNSLADNAVHLVLYIGIVQPAGKPASRSGQRQPPCLSPRRLSCFSLPAPCDHDGGHSFCPWTASRILSTPPTTPWSSASSASCVPLSRTVCLFGPTSYGIQLCRRRPVDLEHSPCKLTQTNTHTLAHIELAQAIRRTSLSIRRNFLSTGKPLPGAEHWRHSLYRVGTASKPNNRPFVRLAIFF